MRMVCVSDSPENKSSTHKKVSLPPENPSKQNKRFHKKKNRARKVAEIMKPKESHKESPGGRIEDKNDRTTAKTSPWELSERSSGHSFRIRKKKTNRTHGLMPVGLRALCRHLSTRRSLGNDKQDEQAVAFRRRSLTQTTETPCIYAGELPLS